VQNYQGNFFYVWVDSNKIFFQWTQSSLIQFSSEIEKTLYEGIRLPRNQNISLFSLISYFKSSIIKKNFLEKLRTWLLTTQTNIHTFKNPNHRDVTLASCQYTFNHQYVNVLLVFDSRDFFQHQLWRYRVLNIWTTEHQRFYPLWFLNVPHVDKENLNVIFLIS
jgi:hypothetical protein